MKNAFVRALTLGIALSFPMAMVASFAHAQDQGAGDKMEKKEGKKGKKSKAATEEGADKKEGKDKKNADKAQ